MMATSWSRHRRTIASRSDGLTYEPVGIVGVDEHQRADAIAVRAFQRGFQFGHVDVPGAVESLLVFDHVDAFEACDRFDERIAGFRCEHGVTGITQQFDKPRVGFGS